MSRFNLRYFLTRFFLAALLTLGILFLFDVLIAKSHSEVMFFHEDVSTTDRTIAEKAYWDSIYDYHKVVKHSKHYLFGKLISETRRYMDGHEVTEGIGEKELRMIEIAAALLVFAAVYSLIPVYLKRPEQG